MKPKGASPSPASSPAPAPPPGAPPPSKLRVLLVDDHPVTRHGLKALINLQPDLVVCGESATAADALELLDRLKPGLAIVDVSLPQTNGLELTKAIRTRAPHVPVLIVSMHDETHFAERALRAGAMGYVMKQEAGDRVVTAIQHLVRGEIYLSAKVREQLLNRFGRQRDPAPMFAMDTLSEREREVFALLGDGFSTRQIAEQLKLSAKTIDSYREHLKLKLNLATGADLVRHAIQWSRAQATG